MMDSQQDKYQEIRGMEHHTSLVHPPLPMSKRAAQFAPFSALSGYEEARNKVAKAHIKSYEPSPQTFPEENSFSTED